MLKECAPNPVVDDWNALSVVDRLGLFSSWNESLDKESNLSINALGGLFQAPAEDPDNASSAASPMSLTN